MKDEEIVAAVLTNGTITNSISEIIKSIDHDLVAGWLTRSTAKFMDYFDCGINWHKLANGRALFIIDEEGTPKETRINETSRAS